jgi:hypothetical protein
VKAVGYTLAAVLAEIGEGARVREANVPRLLLYRTKRLAAGSDARRVEYRESKHAGRLTAPDEQRLGHLHHVREREPAEEVTASEVPEIDPSGFHCAGSGRERQGEHGLVALLDLPPVH